MKYSIILVILVVIPLLECVVQKPKGIHLDVEPHTLGAEWTNNKNQIKNEYLDMLDKAAARLNGTGLLFTVDITFWYDGETVVRDNQTLNFMEEIVKRVDRVAIMDYRDFAVAPRQSPMNQNFNGRSDSMVSLAQTEINFASQVGKKAVVIAETKGIAPVYITFFEEDVTYMEGELMTVVGWFNASSGFDGMAIHMADSWMDKHPTGFTRTCANARDLFHWRSATVSQSSSRTALLQHCANHGVRTLYMHSPGLLRDDPEALVMLLEESYPLGVSIELLAGDPGWSYEHNHWRVLNFIEDSLAFIDSLPSPVDPAPGPCEITSTTTNTDTGFATTDTQTGSSTESSTAQTGSSTESSATQTGSSTESSTAQTGSSATQTGSSTESSTAQTGSSTESSATQTGSSTESSTAQTGSSATQTGSSSTDTQSATTDSQTGSPTGTNQVSTSTGGESDTTNPQQQSIGSGYMLKATKSLIIIVVLLSSLSALI